MASRGPGLDFPDGAEWGFQAKFFVSKPDSSEWGQIDKSVKRALDTHPKLSRYTICLPIDRADADKFREVSWKFRGRKFRGQTKFRGPKGFVDSLGVCRREGCEIRVRNREIRVKGSASVPVSEPKDT